MSVTIYHVEYNSGIIEGRFCSDFATAKVFARLKATRYPAIITEVAVLSTDAAALTFMLNEDEEGDDPMLWGEKTIINPEEKS